jgi:hypothetical protein
MFSPLFHVLNINSLRSCLLHQFYKPLRYYSVSKPAGIDYIGEIEVEEGKCIHGELILMMITMNAKKFPSHH